MIHEPDCFIANVVPPWIMRSPFDCWDKLLPLGRPERWKRKALLYAYGDPADDLVLIRSGLVKIMASSVKGVQRSIGVLGSGSILGEAAFFYTGAYRHDICCVTECEGVLFSKSIVREHIFVKHPDLALYILQNLAAKSYMMSTQLECAAFMSGRQRLAHFLYHLAQEQEKNSWVYDLLSTLPQTTIAEILGMHRVTVTKIINELKREGILTINKRVRVEKGDLLLEMLQACEG